MHKWKGATSEVYSTIHSEGKDGVIGPTLLGSIPDMETEPAIAALAAAEKSYNRGQGVWPTMKVKDRLRCLTTFADKIKVPASR